MVSAFGCTSRVRTECRYVLDLPEFAANTRLARDCSQENLIKVGERERRGKKRRGVGRSKWWGKG